MSGYTPYYGGGWQSGESGGTPITPAALNNMESGIGAALTAADLTVTNIANDFTNIDSHIENFKARKFLKIICLSFSISIGLTNGSTIITIPSILTPVDVNIIAPVFNGSTGGVYTDGAIWVESADRNAIKYYGSTIASTMWCNIIYTLQ